MAKITKCSPKHGMPDGTPVLPGVHAKCGKYSEPGKGCGAEFVTEGNESYCYWLAGGDNSQGSGAIVGWGINCPVCGRSVNVLHPLMEKLPEPERSSSCFVATCCFGDLNAPEVVSLRRWRDDRLVRSTTGRRFVAWYYSGYGSRAADFISGKPVLRRLGRIALGAFIRLAVK